MFFDGTEGPAYALVGARRIALAGVRRAAVLVSGRVLTLVREVADGDLASPVAVRLLGSDRGHERPGQSQHELCGINRFGGSLIGGLVLTFVPDLWIDEVHAAPEYAGRSAFDDSEMIGLCGTCFLVD